MVRALNIVALCLTSACSLTQDQPLEATEYDGIPTCGAERFQDLLGQPEAALNRVNLPRTTRILRPEDAIALDFSPDRLTIDIDTFGRISSVTCR